MRVKCIDSIQRNGIERGANRMIYGFKECVEACSADTVSSVELIGNVKQMKNGIMVDIYIRGFDEYAFSLASTNMEDKVVFSVSYKDSNMVGCVCKLPDAFVINKIQRVIKELDR